MQLLLLAADDGEGDDDDELARSKVDREHFIEVWCIQYFWLINK